MLKEEGMALGFTHVESGPLVRSSYHAEQQVAPEGGIPRPMSHHNVVIISAHPDDMEIGMGGTVAKLVESMAVITSVVVTNGGRSSESIRVHGAADGRSEKRGGSPCRRRLGVKDVIFCERTGRADEINYDGLSHRDSSRSSFACDQRGLYAG